MGASFDRTRICRHARQPFWPPKTLLCCRHPPARLYTAAAARALTPEGLHQQRHTLTAFPGMNTLYDLISIGQIIALITP